jgi:hypothetical protein
MGALEMARLVAEGLRELSADTAVEGLSACLVPLVPLNVVSDKPAAGTVTRGGSFPSKAPITLKAIPRAGETFLGWSEAGAGPASAAARAVFTMPEAPATWRASFRGGSTALAPAAAAIRAGRGNGIYRDAAGRALWTRESEYARQPRFDGDGLERMP